MDTYNSDQNTLLILIYITGLFYRSTAVPVEQITGYAVELSKCNYKQFMLTTGVLKRERTWPNMCYYNHCALRGRGPDTTLSLFDL